MWQIQFVRSYNNDNKAKMGKNNVQQAKIKSKRNIKHTPRCLDSNDSKYLQICQLPNKVK